MSIKLSINDLKDLLKLQNRAIKKRKRRKRSYKTKNDINYNKSSSDHMKSIGFTNTSNEATELIRSQRHALEDKLKIDKVKALKDDEDQLKLQNKIDDDFIYFPKLKYPSSNNSGSSTLRDPPKITRIHLIHLVQLKRLMKTILKRKQLDF